MREQNTRDLAHMNPISCVSGGSDGMIAVVEELVIMIVGVQVLPMIVRVQVLVI